MLAFAHKALIAVVTWLPMISAIVTIHELGHFSVARAFGVAIDRFSIGFGATLFSRRDRHGTEWRIGWLPLGGYVRFAGDDNAASVPDQSDLSALRRAIVQRDGPGAERRYFAFKPVWQRALIVAAGPVANFILAIALFAALSLSFGELVYSSKVGEVKAGSAAEAAGFHPGDVVLSANGRPINSFDDIDHYVVTRGGVPIDFRIQRGASQLTLRATPRETYVDSIQGRVGQLGLGSLPGVRKRVGPIGAVESGAAQCWDIIDLTGSYLGRLVTGQASADMLGGPIRTLQLSGAVATAATESAPDLRTKFLALVIGMSQLAAFISVSLGFMNLLPVPVLDGGHLVFYAYEAVARRPLAASVQMVSYRVGLALLLGLMLFATTNDLLRTHAFHFLGGLFS